MEAFRKISALFAVLVGMGLCLSPFQGVSAAPLKGYESLQVTATGKVSMAPGETKLVSFGFQNVGTETWSRDTGAFVSVYTYGPKYRTSVFQDSSWASASQPAKLTEATVKKGEVGHVSFVLRAPKTAGTYAETFKLAAEDVAWIPGGEFTVNVTVGGSASATVSTPSTTTTTTAPSTTSTTATPDGLSGMVLLRSAKKLTADPNQSLSFTVGVKNTGTLTWKSRQLYSGDFQSASSSASAVVATKSGDTVAPGGMDLITFSFKAPSTKGSHTVSYHMAVDGSEVPDLDIDIPVQVTSDAPKIKDTPLRKREEKKKQEKREEEDEHGVVTDITIDEPSVRIGVMIVDEETDDKVDISCETDWKLYDGDGGLLAELDADESVEAFYKKNRYYYNRGSGLEKTSSYLRFVPDEKNAVCTVENFDRTKTRNAAHPDNQFRNILELRYNSAKDRTWLINELEVEMYLRGLAETSNISHLEFQKTLIVVARTYALYHWERYTKHDEEYFHMNAYADDQVYRGYGQELRTPRLTSSVEATEGVVVTYEGKTAITPYFSRSDGRTRDWGEVWYGDVPWLKGVPAPCDKGKTLWGHGVGMSASEALCQANNGKEWNDILKYFYTGIDLTKRWK